LDERGHRERIRGVPESLGGEKAVKKDEADFVTNACITM
jgi:hypothetical protein